MNSVDISAITLDSMLRRHAELAEDIIRTPSIQLTSSAIGKALGGARVFLKLECLQHTGTFKARGALSVARSISSGDRPNGVTAASAGNHAIATAWAARKSGLSAKVVMQSTANPFRIALAKAEGAEIVLKSPGAETFGEAERLVHEEGRTFIHPFEGPNTVLGTAGVAIEFLEDTPNLDEIVVAVGGGGLIGGIAAAVKAVKPDCAVYGVEPIGASSMSKSLEAGRPVTLEKVDTIADSLAPPMALPLVHALSQQYIDDMVCISDDSICGGLAIMQEEAKLAVEPAAAAPLAASLTALRDRLAGKTVGLVVCGTNIDGATFAKYLDRGRHNPIDLSE
ncbi:MAG: pyridoxal-phosphate dependent enzyme [Pseudomonadota bacterium]